MNKIIIKKCNNKNGITLVALVVTIIVLMILAGITLSLAIGQNGIIGKAQQAKDLTANADIATQEGISNITNELESQTSGAATTISDVSTIKDAISEKAMAVNNNTALKDDNGNTVTIPSGFKIASDSATKQEDGIVIEDKYGNQFVWVPVANISDYKRTDFGIYWPGQSFNDFSEAMPSDEQTSVNQYHGYYIGRYETGDIISTANKTLRESGTSVTNAISIKKGQVPYNWLTRDQAVTLATGMKAAENYNATTRLCSSYAWDTALTYIQNKVSNYATNPSQGNYSNTTFSYTDITGITQTKALNSTVLVPTGQTTPVCNIYDMGGNAWEWTTELSDSPDYPYVTHGGGYDVSYLNYPTCYLGGNTQTSLYSNVAFRVTLYM